MRTCYSSSFRYGIERISEPLKPLSAQHRIPLLTCALGLVLVWLSPALCADWLNEQADIMGTKITVELFHPDTALTRRAADAVLEEMRRIDQTMSPYIETSELARVNAQAFSHPVVISPELFSLIQRSLSVSELTEGAFDITFASVGFLYDYRRGKRPDAETLRDSTPLINYHNLILDEKSHSIRFSKAGVRIDLGGIAKGHAVDRSMDILRKMGIQHALVTAGGDSRVMGDRWGRPWNIGVRDPRNKDALVAVIPLQDVAVSTSGDYERYFEEDGVRYHHIIDPTSGDSARELRSVSIIGPDATTTDALSTSVFVLGPQRGLELVNRLPGIDAILVDNKGQLHYSDGLQSVRKTASDAKKSSKTVVH